MILLQVDVQNLFYSVRDNFGVEARVDFKKLVEVARNHRDVEVYPIAYIAQYLGVDNEPPQNKTIIGALKAIGYRVFKKNVKRRRGVFSKADLDSNMILDAMDLITKDNRIDTLVVASGDADFIDLYRTVRDRNVRVEILGFQDSLSSRLQHYVDEIRILSRSILFDGPSGFDIESTTEPPPESSITSTDPEETSKDGPATRGSEEGRGDPSDGQGSPGQPTP